MLMPVPSGFTIWFTGPPGSGKSTLAGLIAEVCRRLNRPVEVLDGDETRDALSPGLGFSRADRDLHVRRLGYIARLLSRQGVVAIVAAVSPYAAARDEVRRRHDAPFVEVFLECPRDVLIRRDPKGLYAKALRGEIAHFTGVSDPYEPPASPDITLHTAEETPDVSAARLAAALGERGLLTRP
jgi:adenylyl-sulfate kinase